MEEELLSQHFKNILVRSSDINITDLVENNVFSIAEGALLTLRVEAKRRQWDDNQLANYLGAFKPTGFSSHISSAADETIHQVLTRTRARKLKLVGFRCQVHHEIYNSFQGRISRPQCLIEFSLMMGSSSRKLMVSCTPSELQDVLLQFREICHNIKMKSN